MTTGLLVRSEVDQLTSTELDALRAGYAAMQAISDNRGFNYLSGIHGTPQNLCVHYDAPPLFLPWHRAYLHYFEQYLQDVAPGVTVPWWDWTSASSHAVGVPGAFSAPQDAAGTANPLYASMINLPAARPPVARMTRRFPGSPNALPQPGDVDALVSLTSFADFSAQLRQTLHNNIHGWTGGMSPPGVRPRVAGDMGVVPLAAYDPIFYSHHCMIDRIWYLWQLRQGINNIPSNILSTVLPPFGVTVSDVLDIHALGYDYAVSQTSVAGVP
jgi:tyrosinase